MTTIQMITTFLVIGAAGVVIFIIVDAIPSRHSQRIKFNDFINLYTINPDRWELFNNYVDFVKPADGYYTRWKETIMFQFSIIDYYRYQHWRRNLEKQKRQQKECKQLQEVISILKSDIQKFEKENVKRMNKTAKSSIEICGNLKDKKVTAQDFAKFVREEYGYDVIVKPSDTPDTFESIFGASFLK